MKRSFLGMALLFCAPALAQVSEYGNCVQQHRREVDLHNAARQIVEFRDNRARMEQLMQADPQARARYPGGMDQVLSQAFAAYKSFGGSASSVAEVTAVPSPCTPPKMDFTRPAPAPNAGTISQKRSMKIEPGQHPLERPPGDPPKTFTPAATPPLRKALEQALLDYVLALRTAQAGEVEKATSAYFFGTLRNNTARMGSTLTPQAVAIRWRFFPDLNTTTFITVLEKGRTAGLVHASEPPMSETRTTAQQVRFHFFRFVDEGRGWKLDSQATLQADKFLPDGSIAPFKVPERASVDYQVDGRIRPAPAPM